MSTITVKPPIWTDRQKEAAKLLNGPATNILLYGGSRSGKTRLIVEWIVRMCFQVSGLRAFVLRYRRSHAKDTVWHETLITEVLPKWGITEDLVNKSDLMIPLPNGSEIWAGGTDDRARLEKILGHGAGLIYLNEASQISYEAHSLARTRLSQALTFAPKTPRAGQTWTPKIICDCNPPGPEHWTHRLFIDHIEPSDRRELSPERYVSLLMNPTDNLVNLPASYLEELAELPEAQRARFLKGEWTKPEGAIFPEFNESRLIDDAPKCERYVVGMDLVTYAAVLIGIQRYTKRGNVCHRIYCIDEWHQRGALAHDAEAAIQTLWSDRYDFTTIIDHNLGQAGTKEFDRSRLANKGQGSVEAGIVQMQGAMHNDEFFVCRRCKVLRYELDNYSRDDLGAVVKQDDHHIDATRMAVYTSIRRRREIVAA